MMEVAENGILVGLVIRDAEASLDFYQNTLGMQLVLTTPGALGQHRVASCTSSLRRNPE